MPQSGSASQMLSTQAPVAAQSVLSIPAVPFSVSLRAQQYTTESDSWTEPFFKWKDFDFLWYVASNSLLIPFSLSFVAFRKICGPSLEH